MEVKYERGLNHNYMIFTNVEEFCEDYQIHILTEQKIANILSMDLRYVNGNTEIYYDISAKQKLSEWLKIKKITGTMLNGIIKSLINALEAGMDYLLECSRFMLDAEYMFIDVETYELSLCYYPLNNEEITKAGQEFLQYILEMLDYDDKSAVEEAYEIFRLCMRDGFSIELLKKFSDKAADSGYKSETPRTTKPCKEHVQVVPVEVADEEIWEESENFGFIPLNLELRRGCVALIVVIWLLMLVIVTVFFRKSVVALIICGFVTLIFAGAILLMTVFYERIMQYTRLISVRKNISYEDAEACDTTVGAEDDYYKENEAGIQETVCEETAFSENGNYEETTLLSYCTYNTGLRYLHYIGEGVQEDIPVTKNPFIVGKASKDTDYKLDYPFVSRMHLRIEERAGEYYITDTNSKNGIMLNREYLNANETARLKVGDRIEIGNLVFVFQ